ncbi:CL17A protein, partial [Nothocercus nigrocapillus]|nr:CL17A protein [Nothocercus nigrocapillus]
IYSIGSKMTPVGSFRPDSPDSFVDEDDYDDVSLSEPDRNHKKLSVEEDLQSQRSKGGTGDTHLLHRKPGAGAGEGKGCREKSVVTLYVLVALSFAMWVALFLLAVVKYSELARELKTLSSNYSQSSRFLRSNLRDGKLRLWAEGDLGSPLGFQDGFRPPALICKALPDNQRCSAGWKVFEKSCYSFSTETTSWEEAKQICADQSAHLVIVNTDQEQVSWFFQDK